MNILNRYKVLLLGVFCINIVLAQDFKMTCNADSYQIRGQPIRPPYTIILHRKDNKVTWTNLSVEPDSARTTVNEAGVINHIQSSVGGEAGVWVFDKTDAVGSRLDGTGVSTYWKLHGNLGPDSSVFSGHVFGKAYYDPKAGTTYEASLSAKLVDVSGMYTCTEWQLCSETCSVL